MLLKFTVNNFKSLINVTYEPGAINLLLGHNNAGKTNLCQALCFLSEVARARKILDVYKGVYVLLKNVYFDNPAIDLGCTCELVVNDEALTFEYSLSLVFTSVITEQLGVSGGPFGASGVTLLKNDGGQVRLLNEKSYLQGQPPDTCYQDTNPSSHGTMLSNLYDQQANRYAIAFRDYLIRWRYYDLNPERLRYGQSNSSALTLDSEFVLNPDGSNLAAVLFNLKNQDERQYRRLVELVKTIEPRLDAFNFTTGGNSQTMDITDSQNHHFGPNFTSNGTLRFMALCYIILNNARQTAPPLAIIEEPENGLYVRALKPLFELIDPTGKGGQYIFVSHSPYFIDLFDAQIENIVIMENRGTHSTLVKPNPDQARRFLAEMPLGELHYREMLR